MKKMFSKQSSYNPHLIYYLVLFLIIFVQVPAFQVRAQGSRWSVPQIIPGFDPTAWPPILIADQNRVVHAFSSQWIGKDDASIKAIVYNQWTLDYGWTEPIDIILSPDKEARLLDAYLDSKGIIHLVFWGGDSNDANIYYSKSYFWDANKVFSWSTPVLIAENAGDPEGATLTEDSRGNLLMIYHGKIYGGGLYVINSQDGGETWSRPDSIFFTTTTAPLVWNINEIKGSTGSLHIVWNVLTTSGQGRGIYYASTQNGEKWSEPTLLAFDEEGYGTQTPAIIEHDGVIFVFFAGIGMRQSLDNGVTWSNPARIFPRHVGVNGSLSPVIDGSNVLHLFFGQRITGNPDIHGMWHSVWINNRWTEPEAIIKGPAVNDPVGEKSFDPYEARAVVSQENVILVTWRSDPGLKGNGVWYSYQILDARNLPIEPQSTQLTQAINLTPEPVPTTLSQESTGANNQTENTPELFDKQPFYVENNASLVIIIGVIPVILLILGIAIIKITRDKSL